VRFFPGVVFDACVVNEKSFCYVSQIVDDCGVTFTHNNCVCNAFLAFRLRHQVMTPPLDLSLMPLFNGVLEELVVLHPKLILDDLYTRQKVVHNYRGRWFRRYEEARLELLERGLNRRDFWNKCFNKADKEKVIKNASRLIQYMMATGALEMGRFTHPFEALVYQCRDRFGTRIFGKGCNLHTLAEDFVRKRDCFLDPVYLLLDASKFDTHVDIGLLDAIRKFYRRCCRRPRDGHYVHWLWGHALTSCGFSALGFKYKTHGTRFSGHMDTGLGNSLIMYAMLVSYMKASGVSKFSLSVNGDDSVTIIERADLSRILGMDFFKRFGFSMKFEMTDDFSQMEYCQTRPVETDYGWMMCRGPERMLSRAGWTVTRFRHGRVRSYLKSLGLGEMAINYGCPVGYAMGRKLYVAGGDAKLMPVDRKRYISYTKQKFWQVFDVPTISMATRVSYQRAWGMDPSKQVEIERKLTVLRTSSVTEQQQWLYEQVLNTRVGV